MAVAESGSLVGAGRWTQLTRVGVAHDTLPFVTSVGPLLPGLTRTNRTAMMMMPVRNEPAMPFISRAPRSP